MKQFHLLPTSQTHGILYDGDKITTAMFLLPAEAKFQASFRTIRQTSLDRMA